MDNCRTFTLHSQEVKKDKQTFIASNAEIGGKWYKIKFTKECENSPKHKGLYELTINFDNCSVERGKPYVNKDGEKVVGNTTIWVKAIEKIRAFTEDEIKALNRTQLEGIFGAMIADEDLPF